MKALKALRQKLSSKPAQKAKAAPQKALPKASAHAAKAAPKKPAKTVSAKHAIPVKNTALKNGKVPAAPVAKVGAKATSKDSAPSKVGAKVADKSTMSNSSSNSGKKAASTPAATPAKSVTKGGKSTANGLTTLAGLSVSKRNLEILEAVCREVACEGLSTTAGYCRLHYIKNWKKIKRKETILKEGKLNQYIEELVAKYPDKYIEAIRLDLTGDKEFAKVIYDLDLDESPDEFDVDAESADGIIDSIKRDFDDEGETF